MVTGRSASSELIQSKNNFLISAPTGSLLYERGIFINRSFEEVNLLDPNLVFGIYKDFISSGANIICTNTWAANKCKLKAYGLESKLAEINAAGVKLAKQAAQDTDCLIGGIIGPLGVRIEPWGPTALDEARAMFHEQISVLLHEEVDLFILEGFADLSEIQQAITAIRESCTKPIISLMEVNEEGQSLYGVDVQWIVQKLDCWGSDVIGLSGGNGPTPLLELLPKISPFTNKPIALYPNAGQPRMVDGRLIYMASPEYMGEFVRQAFLKGVRFVGGSSGTTCSHMKTMASAVRQSNAFANCAVKESSNFTTLSDGTASEQEVKTITSIPSQWAQKIKNKQFVTCVELLPPKGLNHLNVIKQAKFCKDRGIDAINIPDGPRASARMSPLATACLIEREVGIETILHYTCRDRNLLGIQSDLFGAAALGLNNILCITGDPPKMGPYPHATAVFDIDSIGLVNLVHRLNTGYDLGGSRLEIATNTSVGIGANPVAANMELEKSRFRYKVEAGAQWAITQPVFDAEMLFNFLDFAKQFDIPIIAGIWPLKSFRNAEFMANEVPGVYVPKKILMRMQNCTSAEAQMQEGVQIARELIHEIKSSVQGLQISVPFGMVEFALQILE